MKQSQFLEIVQRFLVPMFPGSRIEGFQPRQQTRVVAKGQNDRSLWIKLRKEGETSLSISRTQEFTEADLLVVGHFLEVIREIEPQSEKSFFGDLLYSSIRRVVSRSVAEDDELVLRLLDQAQSWAEQTYEGKPIAAAIGINPHEEQSSDLHIEDILQEDYGPVLTNGNDTLLEISVSGHVVGHRVVVANGDLPMSPERWAPLAKWACDGRVVVALNRTGESLVFANGSLEFAKRRGAWRRFAHNSVIARLNRFGKLDQALRKSIYETSLDISFARTGGCIGVAKDINDIWDLGEKKVIAEEDWLDTAKSTKSRYFAAILKKEKFQNLPRQLRAEIAAVDGALILDQDGEIWAVGAIMQIESGTTGGGGRLAAAKALAAYGGAVKISADGGIRGFHAGGDGKISEIFTVG